MARKQQMTVALQIQRIDEAIQRDFPDCERADLYYMSFDRPMRVTIRNKQSGDVTLRELAPDFRKLKRVA